MKQNKEKENAETKQAAQASLGCGSAAAAAPPQPVPAPSRGSSGGSGAAAAAAAAGGPGDSRCRALAAITEQRAAAAAAAAAAALQGEEAPGQAPLSRGFISRIPSKSDRQDRATSGRAVRMHFHFHQIEALFINLVLYLNKYTWTSREATHTKIAWPCALNLSLRGEKIQNPPEKLFHTHLSLKTNKQEAKESLLCASVSSCARL
ncbi:uncharacterized protein [Vulpes vulpes]|uniref:Uncharacterized protein isoform X1 n=1 Tax=Vulpes vulpes TaxID=9627 RepID=A0ABM4YVK6_VULVU